MFGTAPWQEPLCQKALIRHKDEQFGNSQAVEVRKIVGPDANKVPP